MNHIPHQNSDGSFNQDYKNTSSPSPFFTSLIAQGLARLPHTQERDTQRKKALSYLLTQQSPHCSYNYLPRSIEPSPYPDDLDDTFSALTALTLDSPCHFTGGSWAHIVSLLTMTETEPGGPYRTWLVSTEENQNWKDIDLVVNSNIQYFLSLHTIQLPKLQAYLAKPRSIQEIYSPYYPDPLIILYFLSRVIPQSTVKLYSAMIKKLKATSPLSASLKVLALANMGISVRATSLEQKIINSYPWNAEPFCVDFGTKDTTILAGSTALTTVLCLEAQEVLRNKAVSHRDTQTTSHANAVKNVISTRFNQLQKPLRSSLHTLLETFWVKDTDHSIALITWNIHTSLRIPEKILVINVYKLCAATVYGWLAYTQYDNFLDAEGDPTYLPAANICLREVIRVYVEAMQSQPTYLPIFHRVMDTIEEANSFEITYCRFDSSNASLTVTDILLPTYPSITYIANRSAGHYLGPLAVVHSSEYVQGLITEFFTHYLTARQLNDDAHDFEDDLRAGRLTYVVTELLSYAKRSSDLKNLTVIELLPHIRTYFWQEYILHIAHDIKAHLSKARLASKQCSNFLDPTCLESLIIPLEKAADLAISEHALVTEFLKKYEDNIFEQSPP